MVRLLLFVAVLAGLFLTAFQAMNFRKAAREGQVTLSIAEAERVADIAAGDRIPGGKGIWAGILSEMTEFALLFGVYFLTRVHFPAEFREGPLRLSTAAGTFNTLLMISGSYFVANAVIAVRENRPAAASRWLYLVLSVACGYFAVKYFEFQWNASQGINGKSSAFFTVYYYLTFTHMVHVMWGICGVLWVIVRTGMGAYSPQEHHGLEAFACYWHATDLAWLVIFPLLYVWR